MAKPPNSVVGIDLGRHALKAVHLQRKHNHLSLTGYASRLIGGDLPPDVDAISHHLKLLFRDLGSPGKACSVAVSSPAALLRIIEQPPTPTTLLRDALRLNGLALLNQDCRDFVLDCDAIPAPPPAADAVEPEAPVRSMKNLRYIVGGLPREEVTRISAAFTKARGPIDRLQLAPVCNYNAFGFSHADIFGGEAFVLVDIGHLETRVFVGAKKELVLARTIDYGGHHFIEAVTGGGAIGREAAILLVEQSDAGMVEAGRASLVTLARELRSSIGFFEGQREEPIHRIYFSGGLVKALMPLQILSDELEMTCDTWDPFQHCHVDLPKSKVAPFDAERTHLNVACGAAMELLMGS